MRTTASEMQKKFTNTEGLPEGRDKPDPESTHNRLKRAAS